MKIVKTTMSHYGDSTINVSRDRSSDFDTIVVPKHELTRLSKEQLVTLYAKGRSVAVLKQNCGNI